MTDSSWTAPGAEPGDRLDPAAELARLRRLVQLQQRLGELFLRFSASVSATLNLDAPLDRLVADINAMLGTSRTSVWLHDRRAHELRLGACSDPDARTALRDIRVPTTGTEHPAARGLRLERPHVIDGAVVAPLRGWRRALGTLIVERPAGSAPDGEDVIDVLQATARQLGIAIENVQLLEDLLRQRRLLEDTFNSLVDLVVVMDRDDRIVETNGAFAARVGRTRAAVLGVRLDELVGPETVAAMATATATDHADGHGHPEATDHTDGHGHPEATDYTEGHGHYEATDHTETHGNHEATDHTDGHGHYEATDHTETHGNQEATDHTDGHGHYATTDHTETHGNQEATDYTETHGHYEATDHTDGHGPAAAADQEDGRRYPTGLAQRARHPAEAAAGSHQVQDERLGGTFLLTTTPLINQDGEAVGRVLVARDITRQTRLETERTALRERLGQSEKLASLGQFVAGVAHEMNNPLQGVLGHLELLIETSAAGRPIQRELRRIYTDADRAAKIVRNLLVFTGSRRMARRRLQVDRIVSRALASRSANLRRASIEVVRHMGPRLPAVLGDPLLLQQALLNLLVNAEHAIADAGGRTGRIELTSQTDAARKRVTIAMRDTGTGIGAEVLPRIFDPFFTTKEVGKGTGLGLAITYGIVQEHGGTISAANAPGGGAVFQIDLPAAELVVK
ncbi:MAG TPA: ATP-binding protein [Vicinamibacterales bacterium]|nr:ATP-binding protein [Vicinamibacterales bacterium]